MNIFSAVLCMINAHYIHILHMQINATIILMTSFVPEVPKKAGLAK